MLETLQAEHVKLLDALRELVGRPDPVAFGRTRVPPPGALYVTTEDRLVVKSFAIAGVGSAHVLRARVLEPDGNIKPFEQIFTPTGSENTGSLRLTEGFLLSVAVLYAPGIVGAARGEFFVLCGLTRSDVTDFNLAHVLFADYLTRGWALGWPGSDIRSTIEGPGQLNLLTSTDPAAGAEISLTMAANTRTRPLSGRFQLVTSGVLQSRQVHLVADDGTTVFWEVVASEVQIQSLTRTYVLGQALESAALLDTVTRLAWPQDLFLPAAGRIRTVTTNLEAGDNFTALNLWVERWVED